LKVLRSAILWDSGADGETRTLTPKHWIL